jgi:membrane-associated phospholipid phosphatase
MDETSTIEAADVAIGTKLASERHSPAVRAVAAVGKLGDQGPLYAAGAAMALIGLARRDERLKLAGLSVFAAVGVADLAKRLIKKLVKRTRPHVLMDEGRYESEAEGSPRKPEQSFPSGHAAGSLAAARALCRFYPKASRATALFSMVMGAARVAKGAHWPLDVAAGYVLGWLAEKVSARVLSWLGFAQPACGERRESGER